MDKKALIVINPYAGTRRANRYLTDIVEIANCHGYECTVATTAAQGDGTRLAMEKAGEMDRIIGIGGDGTFNEIVAGVLQANASVEVGYIPAGSTNDFASSLHLSKNIKTAALDIFEGKTCMLDVGCFRQRYFSYVASFGAFTKASYSAPQSIKNGLGHLAYVLEGMKDISNIHPEHIKIETPSATVEGDYIFGAISNATSIGGILTLNPSLVSMNDGMLEVMLIKHPADPLELGRIVYSLQSKQYDPQVISFFSTKEMVITASPAMDWSLDGEKEAGSERIEVRNLHHALRLRVPKKNHTLSEENAEK